MQTLVSESERTAFHAIRQVSANATIRPCDGSSVRWAMYSSGLPSFARRHQANIADAIFSAGKDATTFYLPKDVSVGMHAFCAIRKKFLQACMPFAPSEKSPCGHACLLRHPKKVPADLRNIFAVGKKSPQACMPFKTSAKRFRSHHHLFRDRKVFCSAAPPSVKQNGLSRISKLQPNG